MRNFAQSTEGMSFNVKRVIGKDYSTVSAAMIAILATEMYKFASNAPVEHNAGVLAALGVLMALVGIGTAIVSYMKRRGAFRERAAS
ncbi:hypothetical protein D9M70_558650 [compost metagenome]